VIPDEAVEAAARAIHRQARVDSNTGAGPWHLATDSYRLGYWRLARYALEAAAPLVVARALNDAAAMLEQAARDAQPPSRLLTGFAAAVATGIRINARHGQHAEAGREHSPDPYPSGRTSATAGQREVWCIRCVSPGHIEGNCPERESGRERSPDDTAVDPSPCAYCGHGGEIHGDSLGHGDMMCAKCPGHVCKQPASEPPDDVPLMLGGRPCPDPTPHREHWWAVRDARASCPGVPVGERQRLREEGRQLASEAERAGLPPPELEWPL